MRQSLLDSAFNQKALHGVLAIIISAGHSNWPCDHFTKDLVAAGLPTECLVRLFLSTLDQRLVIRKTGALGAVDQKKLRLG